MNFYLILWLLYIFFFGPGILLHGGHSHWLTDGGTSGFSDGFITYGQGGWLYVVGFFDLHGFGLLSFILRAFYFWFRFTSLLGAFICEVVGGDLEACFCCCVLLSF